MRIAALFLSCVAPLAATTIQVVPVYEPLSLHGTDVDDAITETGEALQATVMPRPMALSGAIPEDLVMAIARPHRLPSNDPRYKVVEANLLVLCGIAVDAELTRDGLRVGLDISRLSIPEEVDLTVRQLLKLAIVAVRKTLEVYQEPQRDPLRVSLRIAGTDEGTESLRDLDVEFTLEGSG